MDQEVKLPIMQRVYARTIPNPDYWKYVVKERIKKIEKIRNRTNRQKINNTL